jgi:hypothetical protein
LAVRYAGSWLRRGETSDHADLRIGFLTERNGEGCIHAALNHSFVRDWPTAGAGFHRTLELEPNYASSKIILAYLASVEQGDPVSASSLIFSAMLFPMPGIFATASSS